MAAGIKRLYSDEYNAATAEMFDYLKMASKFPIGHHRREYWESKAKEVQRRTKSISTKCNDEEVIEMLATEINEYDYWDEAACEELCKRAGLEVEWEDAFEEVIYHAAEILGVSID